MYFEFEDGLTYIKNPVNAIFVLMFGRKIAKFVPWWKVKKI